MVSGSWVVARDVWYDMADRRFLTSRGWTLSIVDARRFDTERGAKIVARRYVHAFVLRTELPCR